MPPGSKTLLSDGSYLTGFFGVGFFSLPYFQNKETETFHTVECKLHAALKQAEHFSMSFYTCSATIFFLNRAFSYLVCVAKQPSNAPQTHKYQIRIVAAEQSDPGHYK